MACLALQESEQEAENKQEKAGQLEQKMEEMEKAMIELEQRCVSSTVDCIKNIFFSPNTLVHTVLHRLQNSEQERKESDQSDKDMKVELEGKVNALQKQLMDLDTLR